MFNNFFIATTLAGAMAMASLSPLAHAQTQGVAPLHGEQQEADYRVIAARCGTPVFEKAFTRRSRAAVVAGLVSPNREAASVEKTITALRRSPLVLVTASTECPAQLAQLEAIQKQRSGLVTRSRASTSRP
ncbi:hypothetical protein [Variovorax sp. dw_308]|nr:hypothetical protein [Variovorax sp. dw_308]